MEIEALKRLDLINRVDDLENRVTVLEEYHNPKFPEVQTIKLETLGISKQPLEYNQNESNITYNKSSGYYYWYEWDSGSLNQTRSDYGHKYCYSEIIVTPAEAIANEFTVTVSRDNLITAKIIEFDNGKRKALEVSNGAYDMSSSLTIRVSAPNNMYIEKHCSFGNEVGSDPTSPENPGTQSVNDKKII